MPEVQPYIREFDAHIRANDPQISNERLEFLQKSEFKSWFKKKVEHDVNYELFKHLLDGPVCNIFSFQDVEEEWQEFDEGDQEVEEDEENEREEESEDENGEETDGFEDID
ncbi:hypothetical protein POM88_008275 [Heracleum sosnowskyi]|uniref:Uncharacterized protein n=1 Tax=Heracleum sosnowskyi TaxID=360622 RepID=A0AAD8J9L0_9APIA|nr:hypothetical protein POM88_008275 [Heracleum sosnowskyi]